MLLHQSCSWFSQFNSQVNTYLSLFIHTLLSISFEDRVVMDVCEFCVCTCLCVCCNCVDLSKWGLLCSSLSCWLWLVLWWCGMVWRDWSDVCFCCLFLEDLKLQSSDLWDTCELCDELKIIWFWVCDATEGIDEWCSGVYMWLRDDTKNTSRMIQR